MCTVVDYLLHVNFLDVSKTVNNGYATCELQSLQMKSSCSITSLETIYDYVTDIRHDLSVNSVFNDLSVH